AGYKTDRNLPGKEGTTSMSDALAVGEISARRFWHMALPAFQEGRAGVEHLLSELVWREFARELMHDFPALDRSCWRPEWNDFPWRKDNADAKAWRRGQTGIDMVDAGMRELYATGRMHNRLRLITASYLCKHLLTDWRVGLAWFEECLVDWDAASNAMNWQWVAGCGPDASPYFRIFNPEGQAEKFDGDGRYRRYWMHPDAPGAKAFAAAAPLSWKIDLKARHRPALDLAEGRERALAAYQKVKA
ncbi:MAG: deoxyribodipyrimidine photo-lyase, partial [Paracoccaceae bacterium]|nr:deoxyribodipyrimidine photo-lyase [Paracoccaceae bacterium]